MLGDGGGFVDCDVRADVPHADSTNSRADHEHLSPAESVYHVEHSDADRDESDNAVDAGRVQAGVGTSQPDLFEDSRRVEVDGVGAGHLHEDEDRDANSNAIAISLMRKFFELGNKTFSTCLLAFVVDLGHDVLNLFLQIDVVNGKVSKSRQNSSGHFTALGPCIPSGRIWQKEHTKDKDAAGNELDSERYHPLFSA